MEAVEYLSKFLSEHFEDGISLFKLALQMMIILFTFFFCRVLYLVYMSVSNAELSSSNKNIRTKPLKTLVVIGSGGHTMEMLRLMKNMNPNFYSPRVYVMADSDTSSETKIYETERLLKNKAECEIFCMFSVLKFPRSRYVGQSYFASIFSTAFSILKCIPLMAREKPDLILCNGPGTCVPICLVAFMMRVLFLSRCKIIFLESVCRVKSLSLSGHILYYFADVLLVQWSDLQTKYKRATYMGRL